MTKVIIQVGTHLLAGIIVGCIIVLCLAIPTWIIFFAWNNWLQPVLGGPVLTVQAALGIYLVAIVIGGTFKSTTNRMGK